MPRPFSYKEALAWLYGTQRFGIKLGLENMQRLLHALHLPAPGPRIIHVAGTNGKGSVCAMIDAISRAAGHRTGLFTSPHLVTFRERIQVDGAIISENAVAAGLTSIRQLVADWQPHPTFFEITTAIALLHFREHACALLVLETGLGGRLDATNAVASTVAVITPIAYDHQSWLGHTLEEIAGEKAGIIKAKAPVVSAVQEPAAEKVLRVRAAECDAPLQFVSDCYRETPLALAGLHQKRNAALALAALRSAKLELDDTAIARGLASVEWPARFQLWDTRTVIDGAHNPAGAHILSQTWRENFGDARATLILAVLDDKDVAGICRALAPITALAFLPHIRSARAMSPSLLQQTFREVATDIPTSIFPSFSAALERARQTSSPVLITGSLHFAGEALAALRRVPAAFEECAQ
ncbi:MAG: folylpolyglutamate synthase/dihydrofolate synthase family protein [Verrucomicrobiota bacterium]